MYIRRKVFSLLNVNGEDRYFSTTDYTINENGECRLFAEKEEKKKMSGKKKAAIAGATAATAAAAIAGAKVGGAAYKKSLKKMQNELIEKGEWSPKQIEKFSKRFDIANKLQKPADVITEGAKGAVEGAKRGLKKAKDEIKKVSFTKEEADKVAKNLVGGK